MTFVEASASRISTSFEPSKSTIWKLSEGEQSFGKRQTPTQSATSRRSGAVPSTAVRTLPVVRMSRSDQKPATIAFGRTVEGGGSAELSPRSDGSNVR